MTPYTCTTVMDAKIATAINSLPNLTRAVWCMHHIEGWGYRRIGRRLRMDVGAVECHMREANRRMLERVR